MSLARASAAPPSRLPRPCPATCCRARESLCRPKRPSLLQIWRKQPSRAVDELRPQRARVELLHRNPRRARADSLEVRAQMRDERRIVDLDVHLEVQAQAARMEVSRADLCVVVVDVEYLAVGERGRLVVDPHAA